MHTLNLKRGHKSHGPAFLSDSRECIRRGTAASCVQRSSCFFQNRCRVGVTLQARVLVDFPGTERQSMRRLI